MTKVVPMPQFSPASTNNDRFNTHSSSGSSSRRENLNVRKNSNQNLRPQKTETPDTNYQAVVGYIGSVEIPEVHEKKRLQAISACVRKLRLEKRVK